MEDLEWSYPHKRGDWKPGPWDDEPDKIQWMTKVGLPGLIVRNPMGALCGYAGVCQHSPFYGRDYHEMDDYNIAVHGGLTYANACMEDFEDGICHVAPGEDAVWWFGFDCAHFQDLIPGLHLSNNPLYAALEGLATAPFTYTYKTVDYVKNTVEALAMQLVELENTHAQGTGLDL